MSKQALILCGGQGTRFRSISSAPKVLAPFRNKVFLDWLIGYLRSNGYTEINLSMCYKYEEIVEHITKFHQHENINFIIENEPLGTGGAIKNFFQKNYISEVSVFNGDTYYDTPIPSEFQTSDNSISCLITRIDVNQRYGHFQIVDGILDVQRGTPTETIYNSDVFIGIAKLHRDLEYGTLVYPFSLEQLLIENSSKVELIKYDGSIIDFGIPIDYHSLRENYEN